MSREINIAGPINQLGYGIAAINITYEMAKLGKVALHVIGHPDSVPADKAGVIRECIKNAEFYNEDAPSLRIWHENEQASHPTQTGERFGFPFFEVHPLPPNVIHHLARLDTVFVASQWAKGILTNGAKFDPDFVEVATLGVDHTIFNEDVEVTTLTPDFTTFINIGKWEVRKGHDFLLNCFNKAFTRTDKVLLKMLTFNPFIGQKNNEWRVKYLTSRMGTNMHIPHERLRTQEDVAREIASADAGIFPYRAEGWNLDLLECLSMGKPCIATNYSAPTEYINSDNSYLINVDKMEPANDGFWFHGQGEWASLGVDQEEQCIAHMREIHRRKQGGESMINTAGVETAKAFSWENTAKTLARVIWS